MELLKMSKKSLRNVSKLYKVKWKQRCREPWVTMGTTKERNVLKENVKKKGN
jgi:hypothetical protein